MQCISPPFCLHGSSKTGETDRPIESPSGTKFRIRHGTDASINYSISRFSHRRHDDGENLVEMDDGGMVDVDFDQTAHTGNNLKA